MFYVVDLTRQPYVNDIHKTNDGLWIKIQVPEEVVVFSRTLCFLPAVFIVPIKKYKILKFQYSSPCFTKYGKWK